MTSDVLPLSNVLPETAAWEILGFLGLEKEKGHSRQKCLAVANTTGKRCQHQTDNYFCPCHQPFTIQEVNQITDEGDGVSKRGETYQEALTRLSSLLHGKGRKTKRRFAEPKRCGHCQLTWRLCQCPCYCLKCVPGRHLQVPQFYQHDLNGTYQGTESRKIVAIGCRRSWEYRHHPYNHPDCEYCLSGRPCHRVEVSDQ